MTRPHVKALEITTEIVAAKLQNSTLAANESGGKAVADFFKAIYEGVSNITENIND